MEEREPGKRKMGTNLRATIKRFQSLETKFARATLASKKYNREPPRM
jgi:hypothetical protein